jgi:probable HAF family extracellular repeat protein
MNAPTNIKRTSSGKKKARLLLTLLLAVCISALAAVALNSEGSPAQAQSNAAQAPYTMIDLGTLPGGNYSHANGINDSGQVVGNAETPSGDVHAFLYDNGEMKDLGILPGGSRSSASGINDSGQVVGTANAPPDLRINHPFLYENGEMKDLNDLLTPEYSADWVLYRLAAINNTGQVVGDGWHRPTGAYHVFLFEDGRVKDLGTLGSADYTVAQDINESGMAVGLVVGDSTAPGADWHAFLYEGSGPMQGLGTLGGQGSFAHGLNDRGQVVGMSQDASGNWRAFLYENGQMRDLNDLISQGSGWTLVEANAINDEGQIVGWGNTPNNESHAFLLTPSNDTTPPEVQIADISRAGDDNDYTATFSSPDDDVAYFEVKLDEGEWAQASSPMALNDLSYGDHTLYVRATDTSNNVSEPVSRAFVVYSFSGFFKPVDNDGVYNSVKAGSAVPVKFGLGGYMGMGVISNVSPPSVKTLPKQTSVTVDPIEETVDATTSGLSYDQATGQYTYVWKTDKAWVGTDKELTITLADGTQHVALFRFTK